MDNNPYAPDVKDMPDTLALFPLCNVLLLPHGNLPLNIFEPRYVAMIQDALKSSRMIGVIQYQDNDTIYQAGCVGKITEFTETPDGRFLINLTGICRFKIEEELSVTTPYRLAKTSWQAFDHDIDIPKCLGVDREYLMKLLCGYFKQHNMSCDFDKFETIPDNKLITALAMICPFEPAEKQAILEEICHMERVKTFMTMLEMATQDTNSDDNCNNKCH